MRPFTGQEPVRVCVGHLDEPQDRLGGDGQAVLILQPRPEWHFQPLRQERTTVDAEQVDPDDLDSPGKLELDDLPVLIGMIRVHENAISGGCGRVTREQITPSALRQFSLIPGLFRYIERKAVQSTQTISFRVCPSIFERNKPNQTPQNKTDLVGQTRSLSFV